MSPETKIDSIADALRQRIVNGDFGTAGRLPSLRLLSEEYGTTHETMNKVIQRLQAEGLLTSLGRAGVFGAHDASHCLVNICSGKFCYGRQSPVGGGDFVRCAVGPLRLAHPTLGSYVYRCSYRRAAA